MTKDIIIKKKEVWLSESYLVEALKGLSDEYLRKRGRSLKDAWQNQKINGQFYYLFDSIPNKKPTCYQSQLPSVETLRGLAKVKKRTVLGEAVIVEIVERALASDYAGYMPLYRETPAQQRGLAEAAAILAGLADYIVESGMEKRAQYGFLQGCATVLGGMKRQRFYLPTNVRRLQDKVNQMLAPLPPKGGFCEMGGAKTDVTDLVVSEGRRGDITDVIFAPRMGNSNSLKYTDEEVKAWCMILRGSGLNVKTIMIIRKVRLLCEVYGKLIPSEGWFNVFFANWGVKHLTAGGRWADNSHIQRFKSYVPHARPIHAGDAWEMDGTRFNIIAWKEKDAVTGKWHEKYVYMVVVRDVYSGLVLGWAFGLGENRWMYGQALKMAYETVGHLPMTLVSDRFPGHNTDEWIQTRERLTKLGVKCDITSEATGKARIERWIGTLQTVFEMQSEFFYGEGIRSKRTYSHRHPEYMAKLRKRAAKNGWDVTEAVGEAERVIEAYNTTKLSAYSKKFKSVEKSPTELYGESEKPNVRLVASHTKLLVMAETKAMQIRGDMIVTTINGLECEYAVESKETWLNYPSVLVAFDAQDLGTVSLFDAKTEVYLGEASLITKVQRYGTETNPEALGERKAVIAGNELYKKTLFIEMTAAGQGVNEETLLQVGRIPKEISEAAETAFLGNAKGELVATEYEVPQEIETEFDAVAYARGQIMGS